MMKKRITVPLFAIVVFGAVYLMAFQHAKAKATRFMQPLIQRGWHLDHARLGHAGWTWGWSFRYYLDEDSNCFPPSVGVTCWGKVLSSQSNITIYADKYDAWLASQQESMNSESNKLLHGIGE